MTRGLAVVGAIALVCLAAPAEAQPIAGPETCVGGPADPAAFALAQGVVDTLIPPEQADSMMQELMRGVMTQMKGSLLTDSADKGLQEIIDRHLTVFPDRVAPLVRKHIPSQKAAAACAYVREFPVSELREINAFSQSPAGKHYLSRSMAMISDPSVVAANQAYFSEAKAYLAEFQDELKTEVIAYLTAKGKAKKK